VKTLAAERENLVLHGQGKRASKGVKGFGKFKLEKSRDPSRQAAKKCVMYRVESRNWKIQSDAGGVKIHCLMHRGCINKVGRLIKSITCQHRARVSGKKTTLISASKLPKKT